MQYRRRLEQKAWKLKLLFQIPVKFQLAVKAGQKYLTSAASVSFIVELDNSC